MNTRSAAPSGRITVVDYADGLVRVNLTRRQGAREQMVFSVFDRDAPGIPTERPKALIELIQVGDRDSVARIDKEKTKDMIKKIDPRTGRQLSTIRVGDLIYSPAFNPNEPKRFALLGKIDIDRDGVDDRARLKRMIEAAGGVFAYDLPPTGKESGSPRRGHHRLRLRRAAADPQPERPERGPPSRTPGSREERRRPPEDARGGACR